MNRNRFIIAGTIIVLAVLFSLSTITFGYEKEINDVSLSIGKKIEELGKKKIAVVDFTDLQGNVTELGRFIAEELSVNMTMNFQNLEVIDRTHLKTLLQEHALSLSGLTDPSNVQKLGQIAGVEAIITGSVTPFGDNIRVTVKVIATDTAKVITADKSDIAKTKAIEELLAKEISTETKLEVTTQTGTTDQTTTKPASKSQYVVETVNCIYEYKESGFSNNTFYCLIMITSKEKERNVRVYNGWNQNTRIIDSNGNEYRCKQTSLGADYSNSPGGYPNYAVNLLISDVPIKSYLFFENIPQNIEKMNLLEIIISLDEGKHLGSVQFRDIPIEIKK